MSETTPNIRSDKSNEGISAANLPAIDPSHVLDALAALNSSGSSSKIQYSCAK